MKKVDFEQDAKKYWESVEKRAQKIRQLTRTNENEQSLSEAKAAPSVADKSSGDKEGK